MNYPIKMYDTELQCDVDVYKISNPDCFGAHVLVWYNGDSSAENAPKDPCWLAYNIRRLKPSSNG